MNRDGTAEKTTVCLGVDRRFHPRRKPRCNLHLIETVLNRHTARACPESRLAVAVITRAIGDCLVRDPRLRRGAWRFLLGDALTFWCDQVGLAPDFVRFIARKAGYLADEKLHGHWQKVPGTAPALPSAPIPLNPSSPATGSCAATSWNRLGVSNHA